MDTKVYPTIEEIKEALIPEAEKYGISPIWLVGDYATGRVDEDSAIEFLVDSNDGRGMLRIMLDLKEELGVDVLVLNDEFLNAANETAVFSEGDFEGRLDDIVDSLSNRVLLY